MRSIDEVAARIQSQHMSVQAVMQPSPAEPAAPLANGTPAPASQTIPAVPAAAAKTRAPPAGRPGPVAKPNQRPAAASMWVMPAALSPCARRPPGVRPLTRPPLGALR
jgi:hypothetical protein